jgi:hypothetical protein
VSRPKSCTAKIQLSFRKKETKLKRKGDSKSPKFVYGHPKSFSDNSALEHRRSLHSRIAQSVSIALKPPMTFSTSGISSCSLTSRLNTSNLDINTGVSYDDNSNVLIEIESDNVPSLRASINSYLRLADASYRCIAEGNLDS